ALLAVANPERRRSLRDRIVEEGLSVRRAEEEARALGAAVRPPRKPREAAARVVDPDTAALIDTLRGRLQTQVRLRGGASRGRLEIEYYGPEELQRIAGLILGDA